MSIRGALPTIRDVANLADVSPAAVSYVFGGRRSGKDRISAETRRRILQASAQLGYVPNQAARELRRRQTNRISLVLPCLGAPTYDLLANQLMAEADALQYSVMIAVGGSNAREAYILDQLRRRFADGAVFVSPSFITTHDLNQIARLDIAVVALSNHLAGEGFDTVRSTEGAGCGEAVRYLLDNGHRRIAFLGHCASSTSCHERQSAYVLALSEGGMVVDPRLIVCGKNTREEAYRNTRAILDEQPRPTAILAASDLAALSAIWAIRDAGLRVPEDVAVIGVGNIPEGAGVQPALTTVGPPTLDFSAIPHLLFSRLSSDHPLVPRTVEERWQLIVRQSA